MGPRIFGIPALRAPVIAIIRRGPSSWTHVGAWRLDPPAYEPGAWLRGTIYPQRCDLSPDGRWLAYFALKPSATWELGGTYLAIWRLPWLTELAAWGTNGTWTRGLEFVEDPTVWVVDDPDVGDPALLRERYGLRLAHAHAFAAERRRGPTKTFDTPPRAEDDVWDEHRGDRIVMEKPRPDSDGSVRLTVRGVYAGRRELHALASEVANELRRYGISEPLRGIQWADWDSLGRLLVATDGGRLQIREGSSVALGARPGLPRAGPHPGPAGRVELVASRSDGPAARGAAPVMRATASVVRRPP